MDELAVPEELCRNAGGDPVRVVDAAVEMIDYVAHRIGVPDLAGLDVLDFGCGVRFTQAFRDRGVPVGHYVGVDVNRSVIDFLHTNVSDPRFEHFHLDAHNARYNPTGRPLSELTVPEIEGRRFDLVCLFSVFTHLDPDDYVAMLRLLRRFVKPDGRLFYTLFVNEPSGTGFGYVDRLGAAMAATADPNVKERLAAAAHKPIEVPDFRDADARNPMLYALYSRRHALELLDGTGWDLLEVALPTQHMQHQIICSPAA